MLNKIILKSIILFFCCYFCGLSVFAEGTYMLPKANELYESGQARPAYDLAFSIAKDNPDCWEAYKIKAKAAFSLKNSGEALANINKAISILDNSHGLYTKELMPMYNIRAKILFNLAFEVKPDTPNTQYLNALLSDISRVILTLSRGEMSNDRPCVKYFCNLLNIIYNSNCPVINKLKLLNAIMANDKLYRSTNLNNVYFYVYALAIKITYNANDSDFKAIGKTKFDMLTTIRQKSKRPGNTYSFNNDFADLVYYQAIEDYNKANYVLTGIQKNYYNKVYNSSFDSPTIYSLEYNIREIYSLMSSITNNYKRGSTGMTFKTLENESDKLYVTSVQNNSPAAILGIRVGDVLEFDTADIYNKLSGNAGEPIKFKFIERNGQYCGDTVVIIRE